MKNPILVSVTLFVITSVIAVGFTQESNFIAAGIAAGFVWGLTAIIFQQVKVHERKEARK